VRHIRPLQHYPQLFAAVRDGRQHGHGTVDTHREQAPRCVHPAGRAHAAGPAPDRGGRWPERW